MKKVNVPGAAPEEITHTATIRCGACKTEISIVLGMAHAIACKCGAEIILGEDDAAEDKDTGEASLFDIADYAASTLEKTIGEKPHPYSVVQLLLASAGKVAALGAVISENNYEPDPNQFLEVFLECYEEQLEEIKPLNEAALQKGAK